MDFSFKKLKIPDVILIIPKVFRDDRGYFMETYKKSSFEKNSIPQDFVQENESLSKKGVFRGLHYQKNPMSQGKLVRVVKGSAIDYAVDIRKGSPHYGKWVSAKLTGKNKKMLWVPPGFAHGFLSLKNDTKFCYKVTKEYSPEHEAGIRYDDTLIKLEIPEDELIIAEKDKELPSLEDADNNYTY